MKYQVQENCLTIFLPNELDHHNAEEIRRGGLCISARPATPTITVLWLALFLCFQFVKKFRLFSGNHCLDIKARHFRFYRITQQFRF